MPKDYLTVVIELPGDPAQRKQVTSSLSLSGDFHGGRITAMSLEDEITVNEFLEDKLEAFEVDEARAQAKELAARAEAVSVGKFTDTQTRDLREAAEAMEVANMGHKAWATVCSASVERVIDRLAGDDALKSR